MTNETEVIINVYPRKTRSGLDRLAAKFYQDLTFEEEQASMLLYPFCKTERERTLLNSFYESKYHLDIKTRYPIHRKRKTKCRSNSPT